jgi:glycosyltransferase involved in cell wall biosynthesis
MKKILHLASWYPNKNSEQEGDFVQRQIEAISFYNPAELLFVRKDLINIPRGGKKEINQLGKLRETIIYYQPLRTGITPIDKLLSNIKYLQVYKREIRDYIQRNGRPDLIHVHVAMRAGLAALWAKKKYKIPYIVTEHWCGYKEEDRKGIYQEARRLRPLTTYILRNALAIISVSEDLRKSLRKLYDHPRIHIIPNVVNESFFYYEAVPLQKGFKLLHVSSMNYFKNTEGIITAFDKLLSLCGDAELICIGPCDKALENWVNETVSEKAKSQISFPGVKAYKEVAVYMKYAQVLVINSLFETFSCVAAEALLCGLPVISTRVGILPEIIMPENGILVNNEGELLDAMKKMYLSARTGYDRAHIARQYKGRFSYAVVGAAVVDLYESLMPDTPQRK